MCGVRISSSCGWSSRELRLNNVNRKQARFVEGSALRKTAPGGGSARPGGHKRCRHGRARTTHTHTHHTPHHTTHTHTHTPHTTPHHTTHTPHHTPHTTHHTTPQETTHHPHTHHVELPGLLPGETLGSEIPLLFELESFCTNKVQKL